STNRYLFYRGSGQELSMDIPVVTLHNPFLRPRTGAPRKISDQGVRKMVRRVLKEPRTTRKALQKDMEAAVVIGQAVWLLVCAPVGISFYAVSRPMTGFLEKVKFILEFSQESLSIACGAFLAEQMCRPNVHLQTTPDTTPRLKEQSAPC
ncbi:hypothetical protein L3Q82_011766, partial [Scortum barcoo]